MKARIDPLDLKRFAGPAPRLCAKPGCTGEGSFRAPLSRDALRDFQWLCLDHIREHNQSWNYFSGMDADQIEAHRRADVTWHRPSWPFGLSERVGTRPWRFTDPLGMFGEDGPEGRPRQRPMTKTEEMVAVLGLEIGFTLAELKKRYKELVKRNHPDLHGGDRAREEKLKSINEAYTYVMSNKLYA